MIEILRSASSLSILAFAVASMLSAGLSFTFRDIVAPLRRPNRVLRATVGELRAGSTARRRDRARALARLRRSRSR